MNPNHKHVQDAKHVFVVGNGFDLNLKLKTSYNDFVEKSDFATHEAKDNTLFAHLKSVYGEKKWIDIENELKKFEANHTNFQDEYNTLCNMIIKYMRMAGGNRIVKKSHAYNALKEACASEFLVIDFNYTNSVKVILRDFGYSEKEIDARHISIHGSVAQKQIIFGVEDSYLIQDVNNFLQKSYSRIYGGYDVYALLEKAETVSFFGHSLGETDHSYFKGYFEWLYLRANFRQNINIYHFGDHGYDQIQVQLSKLTDSHRGSLRNRHNILYIDTSRPLEK